MFKLNLKTQYAIMAMVYIAKQPHGKVIPCDEIVKAINVPRESFKLVLKNLAKQGVIMSSRGTGGGFYLIQAASQITLRHIVEAAQGIIVANVCLVEGLDCERHGTCNVHPVWRQVQEKVVDVLDKITLEDMAK